MTALAAVVVLVLSACASHSTSAGRTRTGSASSTQEGDTAPPSGPQDYATRHFAVPMTLTVDSWLKTAAPDVDSATLMYWSTADGHDVVRFMLPAIVYSLGAAPSAFDAPADYLHYLHGIPNFTIKDETSTTVGGRPATLLSITANWGPPEEWFSGSLGCASRNSQRHDSDHCFAINPDHQLRLVVIDLGGRSLLGWARADRNSPDIPELYKNFEALLAGIRFR